VVRAIASNNRNPRHERTDGAGDSDADGDGERAAE